MRLGKVWFDDDCPVITRYGCFELLEVFQDVTAIIVGLRIVRLKCDSLVVVLHRGVQLLKFP